MTSKRSWFSVLAICLLGSFLAMAQNPGGQGGAPPAGGGRGGAQGGGGGRGGPPPAMTFFSASAGSGKGADLGGLAGADAICQNLAAAVGRGDGVTWHAYMSTQGPGGVNARDRIGNGPWYNQKGQRIAQNVADLHGDTLDQARLGNNLGKQTALTEKGALVNGVGDMPTQHDMLTGSMPDGRAYTDGMDHTCKNYTSSADEQGVNVQLGHTDRNGGGNTSWNSAHASAGCSQPALVRTGGQGAFYCFAVN